MGNMILQKTMQSAAVKRGRYSKDDSIILVGLGEVEHPHLLQVLVYSEYLQASRTISGQSFFLHGATAHLQVHAQMPRQHPRQILFGAVKLRI
jgi:hypothetical protein